MKASHGFTLVELVAIIVIAGILLVVAGPRFFGANTFAARGYHDAAAGFLRYAQKLAVARHGNVSVLVQSDGLSLCGVATAPCPAGSAIAGPDGQAPFQTLLPSGLSQSASGASVSFDAQGRPGGAFTLTIAGDPPQTLTVEAETGYVH